MMLLMSSPAYLLSNSCGDSPRFDSFTAQFPPLDPATGYDLGADYYDDWKWQKIWGKLEWPHIERLLTELDAATGPFSVLDVGAGTGTYLRKIVNKYEVRRACGVDLSVRMLRQAARKLGARARLQIGDARQLQFPDREFDVLLVCRVASHLLELEVAAREFCRVLRPGGHLILSDLDPRHPYEVTTIPCGAAKIPIVTHKHSAEEWASVLAPLGFSLNSLQTIWSDYVCQIRLSILPSTIIPSAPHPVSYVLCARKTSE
jgi:ubiquinone/menaquinone biosynthesis C-methylase UbiE